MLPMLRKHEYWPSHLGIVGFEKYAMCSPGKHLLHHQQVRQGDHGDEDEQDGQGVDVAESSRPDQCDGAQEHHRKQGKGHG